MAPLLFLIPALPVYRKNKPLEESDEAQLDRPKEARAPSALDCSGNARGASSPKPWTPGRRMGSGRDAGGFSLSVAQAACQSALLLTRIGSVGPRAR